MLSTTLRRISLSLIVITLLGSHGSTALAKELTPAMRTEFGAATWIPADAGYFAATYRTGERWRAFLQTETYQEILTMPAVQMGLAWFHEQPYLAQLAMMRAENPLLDDGLKVLQDAVSHEVFFYVDHRGPGFTTALGNLYNTVYLNSMLQALNENSGAFPAYSEAANRERTIRQVLAAKEQLRMPGIVFGFRLADPQAGRDLITNLTPLLQQAVPLPVVTESLGTGEYLTLPLSAAMFLTPQAQAEMEAELGLADLDNETAEQFIQFVKSQTLSISLGMHGDYLLISLGADKTHLANLGAGDSLAESDALAPLRRFLKPRLIGMSYTHPDWTGAGKYDAEAVANSIQEILQQGLGQWPPGLLDRISTDAESFLNQFNASLPDAVPHVSASFWNQGVESTSYSALYPGRLDSSEPLEILSHAGKSPLMALAAHSPPTGPHYQQVAQWLETLYRYFEDFAVPQMSAADLAKFRQFEALAMPALNRFHKATRDLLIPSLEGGQSLFLMDSGGAITRWPKTKQPLAQPIRFPRPAMVVEVNDPQKFVAAWTEYRKAFNEVMSDLAEMKPNVDQVQLPPPVAISVGQATMYTYAIPAELELASYLNNDFEPHALLTDKHLVLSLSPVQSQELLAENSLPKGSTMSDETLVDLRKPAGRAAWFNFLELTDLLCDDAEVGLAMAEAEEEFDPNLGILIKLHIDKLRAALGAVRNYRSRTYEEDGRQVTHRWLHLRDIER